MKYFKYIFIIALVAAFATSCSKQKEKDNRRSEYLRPAAMDFSKQDSAQIMSLVDSYIQCLTSGDAETAASMIYTHRGDTTLTFAFDYRNCSKCKMLKSEI